MQQPITRASTPRRALGREGMRDLLRRPAVRVLLALTGVGQLAAVQGLHQREQSTHAQAVQLEPVVVSQRADATLSRTPVARSGDVEARELAAKYRAQGFRVSLQLAREIHRAALEADVDPDVAFGLVRAESSFRNSATSHVGAIGLTQLMPNTARWLEPGITRAELRDPETNLRIGLKYLRQLIDKYDGNTSLALTAYNRGPGTVDRVLRRGGNPDNGYAEMVLGE